MELQPQFEYISNLIAQAKQKVYKAVNTELIDLYWNIGEYLHDQVEEKGWGKSVVKQLSEYLKTTQPNIKGFSSQNLWRMKKFFETYQNNSKLSTLLREIPWSHNIAILSSSKSEEEREFYIRLVNKERLSFRELERQIDSSCFERVMLGNIKLSTVSRELPQDINNVFKDSYILEMFQLPTLHSEKDLKQKICQNISLFLLEFGRDFSFMGQEYPLQVGNQDFAIDLLFYHRSLQCMVAIELKVERFKPAHLGQLNFYLEALDRTVKKEYENPSIGILLCKGKDDIVVEFSLNRSLSPTLVADYKTQLPDKKLLKQKWQEILEQLKDEEN
jgi:predicted nuclease of restriction endonuclease-like (RecB) superfamily